jgi:hypothetical protein
MGQRQSYGLYVRTLRARTNGITSSSDGRIDDRPATVAKVTKIYVIRTDMKIWIK